MLIGVIADTHIPNSADSISDKILEAFKHVDMIIHAGDLVNLKVLEELQSACPKVVAVYGNMDPQEVALKLPQKEIITIGDFRIGLMHGRGAPSGLISQLNEEFRNDNVDAIIFGHSHQPLCEKIGKILFFNPGSATDKVFAPYNSYGIIEVKDKIEGRIIKI